MSGSGELCLNRTLAGDIKIPWCLNQSCYWKNEDFHKPVIAIGIYISIATFYFVATIAIDLFRNYVRNRTWYPSKYFSINAFSTTLLGIALKIPTDLTMKMEGPVNQLSKLGGSVLLCTIITMSIPSLGTMDKSEVFSNVVALTVLVVTLVVDIGIQLRTCAIYRSFFEHIVVMVVLLVLLAFLVSTAMIVEKLKESLEQDFQAKIVDLRCNNEHSSCMDMDKVKDCISNYWLLAHTSNPQFVIGRTATCIAATFLSIITTSLMIRRTMFAIIDIALYEEHSDYGNTIWLVSITQLVMIILGNIGPTSRCIWWSRKGLRYVFENGISVEEYWVKSLKDLKESPLRVHSKSMWRMKITRFLWSISLTVVIKLQARVVQLSKLIRLVAIVPICLIEKWMSNFIIWILMLMLSASAFSLSTIFFYKNKATCGGDRQWGFTNDQYDQFRMLVILFGLFCVLTLLCWCGLKLIKLWRARRDRPVDLRFSDGKMYVLHLEGESNFIDFIKESGEKDTKLWINKAMKTKTAMLDKLIKQHGSHSNGFSGVADFDWSLTFSHQSSSGSIKYCWALPIATLACVVVALPDIGLASINDLLEGVLEGFKYVRLVDKNLDDRGLQHMIIAAESVMEGLYLDKKWFGKDLLGIKRVCDDKMIIEELERIGAICLREFNQTMEQEPVKHDHTQQRPSKVLAADCLRGICITILSKYDQFQTSQHLFEWLRSTIADILGACLTNLPQVICMECSNTTIEAREESVRNTALLFKELEDLLQFCYDPTRTSKYSLVKKYIDQWKSRGSIEEL